MNAKIQHVLIAAAAALGASSANALSITAVPGVQGGAQVSVDIVMNFETQSIGGGLIFDFSGPISFVSFAPSAFFNSLNTAADDTDFTGFGTNNKPASAEFEMHFGSFSGIGGNNTLGTMTFDGIDVGTGLIDISISPGNFYDGFFDLAGAPVAVTLNDAQANVVPLPATAWLFATGMGLAGLWRRRRS